MVDQYQDVWDFYIFLVALHHLIKPGGVGFGDSSRPFQPSNSFPMKTLSFMCMAHPMVEKSLA